MSPTLNGARVGLLLAGDHAEQRGLAGAVRADHADDAGRRQREGEVVDEQAVAVALVDVLGLDHDVAEAPPGGSWICSLSGPRSAASASACSLS